MSSLGGNNNDDNGLPANWGNSRNQGPRIGRIGNWGASNAASNSSGGSRFGSLRDIISGGGGGGGGAGHAHPGGGHGHADDDDDDDDHNQGESWFAGGERSGISVQNPNREPGGDLLRELLRKAREGGRAPAPPENADSGSFNAFRGSGNTLGSDEVESRRVDDPDAPNDDEEDEEVAIRRVTFWRNGFSIGDGPLMFYDNPEHAQLLQMINEGKAPPHILGVRIGQPVEVHIDKRLGEDYQPPPKGPAVPFSGGGQRLGSPAPNLSGGTATSSASTHDLDESRTLPGTSQTMFEVDQSQPTTRIQIRFHDSSTAVVRMNQHVHTVGDVRNFINFSRRESADRPYNIISTASFPQRVLTDENQTIAEAKLENAVIMQRWI